MRWMRCGGCAWRRRSDRNKGSKDRKASYTRGRGRRSDRCRDSKSRSTVSRKGSRRQADSARRKGAATSGAERRTTAGMRGSHRSKTNIGTVFSRSHAAPSPRPSQIANDLSHHARDRMAKQLRHRSTKARGREERHIKSSWPDRYRLITSAWCRHANSYHIIQNIVMKAFHLNCSALSHCLLPLCCVARRRFSLLALRRYRTAC